MRGVLSGWPVRAATTTGTLEALPFEGTTNFVATDTTPCTVSFTVRPAGHDVVLGYFGGSYAREFEKSGALETAAREDRTRSRGPDSPTAAARNA